MDRESTVVETLPVTHPLLVGAATATAARASTSATAVRSTSCHKKTCTPTRCLLVATVLVFFILYCVIFPVAYDTLSPNIPSHPEFNVASAAVDEAAGIRFGILVSNPNCCGFLSFTNVTLAAAGVPFGGGGGVLQHPPFQVAGNQTAMLWFHLQNATNSSSAGGAPLLSLELNATIRSDEGVKWPATRGEISMTTRCHPIRITYDIDYEATEARGCKRRSRDQWEKDGRRFGIIFIIVESFAGVALVAAFFGGLFLWAS